VFFAEVAVESGARHPEHGGDLLRYLSDPAYRRKIARQLNKGESLHALCRDLHYANQGSVGHAHQVAQSEQAWCLTLLTNAVITWTTWYYELAVEQLRADGRQVPDEVLAHISPTGCPGQAATATGPAEMAAGTGRRRLQQLLAELAPVP
jgi:Tn3 transposase DDE domain